MADQKNKHHKEPHKPKGVKRPTENRQPPKISLSNRKTPAVKSAAPGLVQTVPPKMQVPPKIKVEKNQDYAETTLIEFPKEETSTAAPNSQQLKPKPLKKDLAIPQKKNQGLPANADPTKTHAEHLAEAAKFKAKTARIKLPTKPTLKDRPSAVNPPPKTTDRTKTLLAAALHKKKASPTEITVPKKPIDTEAVKKQTARIDLSEVTDQKKDKEIFKRRTTLMESQRITDLAKDRVSVKKTPHPRVADSTPSDLPANAAATSHPPAAKTIRIKRASAVPTNQKRPLPQVSAVDRSKMNGLENEKEPGIFYSILSLAAVLVATLLAYVLIAQTLAPSLPFPTPM